MIQYYLYNKETGQVHATDGIEAVQRQLINHESRRVGLDTIGATAVSTVFLSIPSFDGMLFETAVNRNDINEWEVVKRYQTAGDAKRGHRKAVKMIEKEQGNNQK